ncbi:hypothetical protein [Rhodococcus opacus]|uniref:hypothetical protein n=1 Tax=Rhodococcus opacus TaxID=37919 RepID=UPI001057554B|nr:hypothetical protein [Rhodococcus opacus]
MAEQRRDGDRDRARARRDVARRLHPDRGGDPAAFVAALAAIDGVYPALGRGIPGGASPDPVQVHHSRPVAVRRWARTLRRSARAVRRRIPGTRRYIDV